MVLVGYLTDLEERLAERFHHESAPTGFLARTARQLTAELASHREYLSAIAAAVSWEMINENRQQHRSWRHVCGVCSRWVMAPELRPIYLLADSQLLFWKKGDALFLQSVLDATEARSRRAAYIGVSNGDAPEYYDIFQAAMGAVGIRHCEMIPSAFSAKHEAVLNDADIILLAGGDVVAGWRLMCESGMKDAIVRRYRDGATLIGVSAGAVQLGLYGLVDRGETGGELFETFKLFPFVVAAHDENGDWSALAHTVQLLQESARGIGIPAGAGLVYHRDRSVEAVRHPSFLFFYAQGAVHRELLLPKV